MHKIENQLSNEKNKSMFQGILMLVKGSIVARGIGIVSIPLLSRLYSPESFGVLALYVSITAIIAPVLTLRYVQSIPLPKSDAFAINLFFLSLMVLFFNSIILMFVSYFWGKWFLTYFSMQHIYNWLPLIVLGCVGSAVYELFNFWCTRKKQYKILANAQMIQSFLGSLTKILLGLMSFAPLGLLLGQFFIQTSGINSFIKYARQEFKLHKHKVKINKILFAAKYFSSFPLFRLPSHILMVLSVQAPIIMTSGLYDEKVTGQLSLALLALSLPSSLIGAAVAKAYYAEIASLGKNKINKIKFLTYMVQKKLFLISIPITILVFLFSEPLFSFVFGEEWIVAGEFASILAPYILFQFTSAPLMEVLNVVGSQLNFLILHMLRFLGLICIFYFSKIYIFDVEDFMVILSSYLSLFYLMASLFVILSLKRKM